MFMGIYTEPQNHREQYKGLYRMSIPSKFWVDKSYGKLYDMSRWYMDSSIEGAYFKYSDENFNRLFELYMALKKYLVNVDLLVFGSDFDSYEGEFLGYDVVGDGNNLSILDTMLFRDGDNVLFDIIYDYFRLRINKYGLFKHSEDANRLVELYYELTGKYRLNLETINNPKPTVIYRAGIGEV